MADRRGFALPLMLGILAVGSILVAGAFLMARLEAQSGANGRNAARALQAAESGLSEIIAWWDAPLYNQLAPGESLAVAPRGLGRGGYSGRIRRLSPAIFEVESRGWFQSDSMLPVARRVLRALARLTPDLPLVPAALTVVDSITWDGGSLAIGRDTIPPGWGGCTPDTAVSGLARPVTAAVVTPPCAGCLQGNPPETADSAISVAMLSAFGSRGYNGLAARASYSLAGAVGPVGPQVQGNPAQCVVGDSLNWGEPVQSGPFAACARYFPVIHSPGDLRITGGRGQGVLLVDGDLELGGNTAFYGLVIVRGTLRNGPGGGSVVGALLTRSIVLSDTVPASTLLIRYSACVLPTTASGSSQAFPLPYRSWAQSF